MTEDRKLLYHNFYVFAVEDRLYGIDIGHIREVKEILSAEEVTPLPHSQPAMLGYINVRGAIHQVLCLRCLLGLDALTPQPGGMIIYCKDASAPATGLCTRHPGEMMQISEKQIDRWEGKRPEDPAATGWGDFLTCGACRTDRGVMTMLSPKRIYQAAAEYDRKTTAAS